MHYPNFFIYRMFVRYLYIVNYKPMFGPRVSFCLTKQLRCYSIVQ